MIFAAVAKCNIDEENILLSLYAKTKTDGKIITKINRIAYDDVISNLGLDSIIAEVEKGNIDKSATIMLNITGGGEKRATEGKELWYLKPSLIFDLEPNQQDVVTKVEALFK